MSQSSARAVRLSALALATGTLLVSAATGALAAPAAPSATLFSYAGNTGSSVVSAAVNIPSTLASPLTPVLSQLGAANGSVNVSLLDVTGSLQHDATGKVGDIATSVSTLAGGTLFDKGGALAAVNKQVVSTLALALKGQGTQTSGNVLNLPSSVAGLLNLGLPTLKVQSIAGNLQTLGSSEVAGVQLGHLTDLLPAGTLDAITGQLNSVAGTAATGVSSTTTTVTSTLSGILGQLPTNSTVDLSATVKQVQTVIDGLTAEVPKILVNLEDGSIVSVSGITTTHDLKTVNGTEISTAGNKLAHVNVLGGLFTLDGFENSVTTMAGGAAGTGKSIVQPNVAKVTVGTNNELQLVLGNITTLTGTLPGVIDSVGAGAVKDQLTSLLGQLTTLQGTLNTILNVAGVDISVDKQTVNDVAKDGTSAKAALSGLSITVNPALLGSMAQKGSAAAAPLATAPLVDIQIGAVQASSAASRGTAPASNTTPNSPVKKLAYTGADLPVTAGVATLLVAGGTALVVRRRRAAAGSDL